MSEGSVKLTDAMFDPPIHHLSAGARGRTLLVRDDEDRYALLDAMGAALGALVLAFCLMDTHLHVVVEGEPAHTRRWLDRGLTTYARAFRRRHGRSEAEGQPDPGEDDGALLRGPIHVTDAVPGPDELARTIYYVHENPVKSRLVDEPFEHPWSSARAFAGLSLAPSASVDRALDRLGAPPLWKIGVSRAPPLGGIDKMPAPTASPAMLLHAIADTYGLRPWAIASKRQSETFTVPRAAFLRLGKLEGYQVDQLAPYLAKSRSHAFRLANVSAPDAPVQVARALLGNPAIRCRLRRTWPVPNETVESHLAGFSD